MDDFKESDALWEHYLAVRGALKLLPISQPGRF